MDRAQFIELAWEALKQQCASDPKKAVRLVIVEHNDVKAAMSKVWDELKLDKGIAGANEPADREI